MPGSPQSPAQRRRTPAAGHTRSSRHASTPPCPSAGRITAALAPAVPAVLPQVRATDGRRKLSTVVKGADLAKFQESYTTIMRVSRGAGCSACFLSPAVPAVLRRRDERAGRAGRVAGSSPPAAGARHPINRERRCLSNRGLCPAHPLTADWPLPCTPPNCFYRPTWTR